jgi:hypothetical protein
MVMPDSSATSTSPGALSHSNPSPVARSSPGNGCRGDSSVDPRRGGQRWFQHGGHSGTLDNLEQHPGCYDVMAHRGLSLHLSAHHRVVAVLCQGDGGTAPKTDRIGWQP